MHSRTCIIAAMLATAAVPGVAKAQWESRELAGMAVEIYTPAAQSPIGDGRALLAVLHGCTQTAVQLREHGNFEHTADALGVVVAIPRVPDGGVVAGCWDYYGSQHTRSSGYNGNLIELVETMRDDPSWGIDPDQMYVAGLSSGGGQALVVGCLAPELFAGVGVAAGPSLGTSALQISLVSTTAAEAATLCTQLAGAQSAALATQLAVTFTDTLDFTVAQGYAAVNAQMYAQMYATLSADGAPLLSSPFDMAGLPGNATAGTGTEYADGDGPRIAALLSSNGVGHAWPSGSGMQAPLLTYVSGNGLDFGRFLAEFFADNNRRASGASPGDETGGESGGGEGDGGSTAGEGDGSGDGVGTGGGGGPGDDDGGEGDPGGADGSSEGGDSGSADQDDGSAETGGCQCSAPAPGSLPGTPMAPATGMLILCAARRRRR